MARADCHRTASPIRILQWGMSPVFGGTETFIMNLYRHIDREKIQFDFLADREAPALAFEDEILSLGGHIYRVTRSGPFGARQTLPGFYRAHPEIIGVHVHANVPYATPLAVAKQAGIPLRILHSHNSGTLNFSLDRPLKQRFEAVAHTIFARHDINTSVTDFFACSDMAAQFMFSGKPYRWIRNGIDTAHFAFDASAREKVRAELDIGADTTVIGYCGRLREEKSPLFLVDVFAEYHRKHPDSLLTIVGDGPLHERIVCHAAERGLSNRVRMLGGDHRDVAPYYQAMDAFVLPSLHEGFPIVLQEAQCSGLPCLASTNMTTTADTVGLVRFRDLDDGAEAWADELHDMIASTPRADHSGQLRAAGFDVADVAREVERFYLEHARAR
ncbi:glycosyltransferase [Bifidobacterium sp. CP2]|nr:glycosyltransferase [Bifidobacterium sp. CP2]MBT1182128.1 glycosyltransferase [Bifidobacterium sp. CP2]